MKKIELVKINNILKNISQDKENLNAEFSFFLFRNIKMIDSEITSMSETEKLIRSNPSIENIQRSEYEFKQKYFQMDRQTGQLTLDEETRQPIRLDDSISFDVIEKENQERISGLKEDYQVLSKLDRELQELFDTETETQYEFKKISIKKVPEKYIKDMEFMEVLFEFGFNKESIDEAYDLLND